MQTLPVILAVLISAAAIIAVLLWRIQPQTAPNTELLDKRISEEVKRAETLQAKLEAKENALRTAEANSAAAKATMNAAKLESVDSKLSFDDAKLKLDASQVKLNQAQPLVERANAEKESAEAEAARITKRHDTLALAKSALQEELNKALGRAATAEKDAENMRMRMSEIVRGTESLQSELTQERQKLDTALAKQQSNEDAARHFENIGKTILAETLEQAKIGVGELAATFQKSSSVELEKHAGKIAQTLEPLHTKLEAYEKSIKSMEEVSHKTFGGLVNQINELQKAEQSLHNQAQALTSALTTRPKMRGNYGEITLRRLVESVGMLDKYHFEAQASRETEEGRRIPDLVIFLPGGQKVIIDAKAVLNACIQAYEADDESLRKVFLKQHSENVKSRVSELSEKNYFSHHAEAVESVVLFLPTDSLYFAALENDPDLIEFAASKRIIICSPGSLIMLLTVTSHLWRQASIEKEAQDIKKCGEEIYKSACLFIDKFADVGKKIKSLEKEYNEAVGTLEGSVIRSGKRMSEFESVSRKQEMKDVIEVPDELREFKPSTRQLAASTAKLPGLSLGEFETAKLNLSSGDE